ncbi:AraC family transcriptional regulator ligand-binding domain-containing protein [Fontibacter flavus]|uniref:AraC family transcriptional regulator ligand-binding domain-containing protein n=1 Tax=Fontibacter flavus TaxID=654838 RepID=A0ABV6FX64_9BACT
MKIQATYIANLFEYASYKGIPEQVLRGELVEKDIDVCNPNNWVTETDYLKVFEAILKETDDGNFGIHYGCYLNLKALGLINQISLHASSINQAVFILHNYLEDTFPLVSLEARENSGKYILSLRSNIRNAKMRNQVLEFVFCFIFRELKLMLSNDLIPDLEVSNSNLPEFEKSLNVEIKEGVNYSFVFNATVLDTETNKRKIKEIEILLPKYLQMLEKGKTGYKEFSMQVRNMVLNLCSPELPTFEQVAMHFPLSSRTIQRNLKEEGLTFRKITSEIKNELSTYLSKGHNMKTQDIAYILGYSEASAYLHAVKKWETELLQ